MDPSIVLNCCRKSGLVHENSEVAIEVSDNEVLFGDEIDDNIQSSIYNESVDRLLKKLLLNQEITDNKELSSDNILKIKQHLEGIKGFLSKADPEVFVKFISLEGMLNDFLIAKIKKKDMRFYLKKKK